jgi:hypothetical protein
MWTLSALRCTIAGSRAVPAPGTPESQVRRSFLPMNHKERFRLTTRLLPLFMLVVVFASTASAEWKEKVLYSFQGGTSDGSTPAGGVVFDSQGNLYGATTNGGPASCKPIGGACGTVFQLSPPTQKGGSWSETLIYQFQGKGSNDASAPSSGLIRDAAGNLYGVTAYGGTGDCVLLGVPAGCGTVYELSPPQTKGGAWTCTILYSFKSGKDGYLPVGDLVFDSAGNLYGATDYGGGKGTTCNPYYQYCGTVFEMSPPKTKGGQWTEKVLHSFAGGTDGANPNGGLVLDSKGDVYGTTFGGGNESGGCGSLGCGTAFKLKPPTQKGGAWTEKVLYRFNVPEGAAPTAGLVFGGNGDLYGTVYAGGTNGNGAVFDLAAPKGGRGPWIETMLHRFSGGNDGANPTAGLIFDSEGNLYGTTNNPTSQSARGNVFRLKPPPRNGSWVFGVIYTFKVIPDGEFPGSRLVLDTVGNLYGTTQDGGSGTSCSFYGCGTVFEVSP